MKLAFKPKDIALTLGGAVVAGKVSNMALPIPEQFKPVAPVVVGVLLMMTKNKSLQNVGLGMTVYSGVKMIGKAVPALGIGEMNDWQIEGGPAYVLNGPNPIDTNINGSRSFALSGINDDDMDAVAGMH
jgi:hypothetical protein